VALQIFLNNTYKLNHCKEMGAERGRRFLIQPAAKLEPVIVATGPFPWHAMYKFLECKNMKRLSLIDDVMIHKQTGFRLGKSCKF